MKMKNYVLPLLLLVTTITSTMGQQFHPPETAKDHEVNEWFNARKWLGKTMLIPDSSINKNEFYVQYHNNTNRWKQAFDFLKSEALDTLKPGIHELDGRNLFVIVSEYTTKSSNEVYYESHRNYTDIHYVVTGEEYIGLRNTEGLTVKTQYDTEKDIVFYNEQDQQNFLAHPGVFFIAFPSDAHRPSIAVNEKSTVKKIVIKVRD